MSLDTLVHIGNCIRNANDISDKMKYHRFAAKPIRVKDGKKDGPEIIYLSINIDSSYNIDFGSLRRMSENEIDSLCYFDKHTSDNDTSKADYLYGDIFYSNLNGEEKGNCLLSKIDTYFSKTKINALIKDYVTKRKHKDACVSYVLNYEGENIESLLEGNERNVLGILKFWREFTLQIESLKTILKYAPIIKHGEDINEADSKYSKYIFDNQNKASEKILRAYVKEILEDKKEFCKNNGIKKLSDLKFSHLDGDTIAKLNDCQYHTVFLHFVFMNVFENEKKKTSWYSQAEKSYPPFFQEDCYRFICTELKNKISSCVKPIVNNKEYEGKESIVIDKYIYPTIGTGDDKNDIQFPNFDIASKYKVCSFNNDSFEDFLYADAIRKKIIKRIKGTNIQIHIFPHELDGKPISAKKYEDFYFNNKKESSLFSTSRYEILKGETQHISFDYVFGVREGQTENYLFELAGLQYSLLAEIEKKHSECSYDIAEMARISNGWQKFSINVEKAYANIIGPIKTSETGSLLLYNPYDEQSKDEVCAKYQAHLLKVLPMIYQEAFYNDGLIFSELIDKIEYCARNINGVNAYKDCASKYFTLLYSYKFICMIQNKTEINMIETDCYTIGKALGKLSKPLKNDINSFQKNYVGMITRRASNLSDSIALRNEIVQKLIMHERTVDYSAIGNLEKLSSFDKEEFASGFFEGYFSYQSNEDRFVERIGKVLNDYEENESLAPVIGQINEIIENYKNQE